MTADLSFCHADELFMLTQWHRINHVGTGHALSFKYTFHPLMTQITQIFHLYIIPKGYYLSA